MTKTKADWQIVRQHYLEQVRARGVVLTLRDRVWASTDDGRCVALPGVTATTNPDQWWLGYDKDEFHRRGAVGAILLCDSIGGPLLDFGLPADVIRDIEPDLPAGTQRPQLYFNVFRRSGNRFELQLRGARPFDITGRRGDVSWLVPATEVGTLGHGHSVVAESAATDAKLQDHRFFAKLVRGVLEPLDPVNLEQDATYLVHAQKVDAVPSSAALRRIVARGGPSDLPPDFAEQHDHYAHGAPKR